MGAKCNQIKQIYEIRSGRNRTNSCRKLFILKMRGSLKENDRDNIKKEKNNNIIKKTEGKMPYNNNY